MMWSTLHSHEVVADFYKHKITCYPSITSIFVHFLDTAKIYEPPPTDFPDEERHQGFEH